MCHSTRTKRWMASKTYSKCFLLYPRLLALERAPLGLPAGHGYQIDCAAFLSSYQIDCPFLLSYLLFGLFFCFLCSCPAVIAPTRAIGADVQGQILNSLSMLRDPMHDLGKAADWLEAWANGDLAPAPLLPVDAFLIYNFEVDLTIYLYFHIFTYTHKYIYLHIYIYLHLHIYIYIIYMYIYIYLCIFK